MKYHLKIHNHTFGNDHLKQLLNLKLYFVSFDFIFFFFSFSFFFFFTLTPMIHISNRSSCWSVLNIIRNSGLVQICRIISAMFVCLNDVYSCWFFFCSCLFLFILFCSHICFCSSLFAFVFVCLFAYLFVCCFAYHKRKNKFSHDVYWK